MGNIRRAWLNLKAAQVQRCRAQAHAQSSPSSPGATVPDRATAASLRGGGAGPALKATACARFREGRSGDGGGRRAP
eukprot:scaffold24450_cov57-Phaeocystis_antarctica.AAC.2